jgi:hypothetical protein
MSSTTSREGSPLSTPARYGPGDYFGEGCLLENGRREQTVRALGMVKEKVFCATLARDQYLRLKPKVRFVDANFVARLFADRSGTLEARAAAKRHPKDEKIEPLTPALEKRLKPAVRAAAGVKKNGPARARNARALAGLHVAES